MRSKLIPPLLGYYTMVSSGRTDGIVESGLVVEYKFDEGSGTTVKDHISGYDMTFGAGAAAPAWDSLGLDFDGSNDYISAAVPDSVFLGANGFTVISVNKYDAYKNRTYWMSKSTVAYNQPIDWKSTNNSIPNRMGVYRGGADTVVGKSKALVDFGDWRMFGIVCPQAIETPVYQYVNACRYYADIAEGTGTGAATGADNALAIGYADGRYIDGHVAYTLIYNRQLTQAEMEQNYKALINILAARSITLQPIGIAIVCKGDSLTWGNGISAVGQDYPTQLKALIGTNYDVWNLGVTGQTITSMVSTAATEVDQCISTGRTRHICIIWAGSNDIDAGTAATTVYANLETYIAARKTAGFDDVIVLTALDRAQYDAAQRIQYAAYNTLIKDGAATGGYTVADVDGDARLQDYTDTTYFNADQVHLVAAGYAVVAGIVKTAIEAVMAA